MSLSKPSLSYMNTPQQDPFIFQTIPERLELMSTRHPDKLAFIDVDENGEKKTAISYAELYKKSLQFARGLQQQNVEKGDIIGIILPNSAKWLYCSFGAMLLGCIPMYLHLCLKDGSDMLATIKQTRSFKLLIIDINHHEDLLDVLQNVFGEISDDGCVQSENVPDMKRIIFDMTPTICSKALSVEDILIDGEKSACDFPTISPEDLALYFLTSGTTAVPKVIQKSHMHLLQIGNELCHAIGLRKEDVYFNFQSLCWEASSPICLLIKGITRISCDYNLMESDHAHLTLLSIIKNQNCTAAMLNPSMLMKLSEEYDSEETCLRVVWTAGVPIPSRCSKVIPKSTKTFVSLYGSSEVGVISSLTVDESSQFVDFDCGVPTLGTDIKVVDDEGKTTTRETAGEIYVRKSLQFLGYLTKSDYDGDIESRMHGWYKTGDIGHMTRHGHLIVTGRKFEQIKISNDVEEVMVSPCTIEKHLKVIPGVVAVCVIPFINEHDMAAICACMEIKNEMYRNIQYIQEGLENQYSEEVLHHACVPSKYVFFDYLPRSSTGKMNRKKIAEMANIKTVG